jgi:hypothetical protein
MAHQHYLLPIKYKYCFGFDIPQHDAQLVQFAWQACHKPNPSLTSGNGKYRSFYEDHYAN